MSRLERVFYSLLIILAVFTIGVQFGIWQGRQLEYEEQNWEYCNGK